MDKSAATREEETPQSCEVADKYRAAGEIANSVLKQLIELCVENASVIDLCEFGDSAIKEKLKTVYNKKSNGVEVRKEIAFPTCIAVNDIMGNYSPIKGEKANATDECMKLKNGDMVKVDFGVAIGGYPVMVGHTVVVGGQTTNAETLTGRKADVLVACHTAMEAALKTIEIGVTNDQITKVINDVYSSYDCRAVRGVLSHAVKRYCIDDPNFIIQNDLSVTDEKIPTFQIQPNQVFVLEIMATTGSGLTRETSDPVTVYQRDPDNSKTMRTKATRAFLAEIQKSYPYFPYNSRNIEDKITRSVGTADCLKNFMIQGFRVVAAPTADEAVAKFTATVIVTPKGPKRITGISDSTPNAKSDRSLTDHHLKELLTKTI